VRQTIQAGKRSGVALASYAGLARHADSDQAGFEIFCKKADK